MGRNAIKILEDDALHQAFRQEALLQAKQFDIGAILPQYEQYYEAVMERSMHQAE